jgi:signal transduction histidine kinase
LATQSIDAFANLQRLFVESMPLRSLRLTPVSEDTCDLAAVADARRRMRFVRLLIGATAVIVFHAFLPWSTLLVWFALSALITWAESLVWTEKRGAIYSASLIRRRLGLLLILLNSAAYSVLGLAVFWQGGRWGAIASQAMIGSLLVGAVLTSGRSRSAFTVAVAPHLLYLVATPFMALALGASFEAAAPLFFNGLFTALGTVSAWRLFTRALSAEQVARMRAEQATEAKSAFVAMVSHDLRTPISGVTPCIETVK